jgi:capsular exopolysaccharide synthesis family protein
LIIEKENPNVVSIQEVMAVDASGTDYYQTQYKIMESRTVAREVIGRLNLHHSQEFFPEPPDNFIANTVRAIKETLASWGDSMSSLLKTDQDRTALAQQNHNNELVSDFIKRIKVEPIRNSRLVDLSFQANDPVMAAKIVRTLAEAYIDQNLETRLKAVQDAVKWLHNRIELERKKVEKAELALLKYKEEHNIVTDFSSDTEKITAQKLAQLNTQVVESESRRVEAETRYKQAVALERTPDMLDSIPEVLDNELIRQIKAMEVDLYKRMSELSKKYGSKHPHMIAIQSELNTLQKRKQQEVNRVINSLRNEYKVALAKENTLKAALAAQKQEALTLNQKAITYGVLRREAESTREMYELLIKRFKETTLTEDMRTGNISVVDKAEIPNDPVKPRKRLNIFLSLIVGLLLGTGLAFFFEYLDNTVKDPEEIKRLLEIPFLGPVPAIISDRIASPDGQDIPELVTLQAPQSPVSEAYRGIRTNILFSAAGSEPQVILIASAGPHEGKTLTATNLAITMAQSGSKVIILDCDLRRPKLHQIFEIEQSQGVTHFVGANETFQKEEFRTVITNLYVMPSGPIPPNPSEILGSQRMADLLGSLRKDFNRIIIDSPPIAAVTDAVVLSNFTDGTVYVIRAHETVRGLMVNGLDQLRAVGAHLLGAILNGVDMIRDGYYSNYYYYYYGREEKKKKK